MKSCNECQSNLIVVEEMFANELTNKLFSAKNYQVVCYKCGAKGNKSSTRKEAVEEWQNTH